MIDTRSKIVGVAEAKVLAVQKNVRTVTAYLDPILPNQIERLRELAADGRLLVILETPPDSYLEVRARAELAASLHFVCGVVIGDSRVAAELGATELYREHPEEARLRDEFIQYVRERVEKA